MTRLIRKVDNLELWGVGPEGTSGGHRVYEVIDASTDNRWSRCFERRREADALLRSGAHINADGTLSTPRTGGQPA